MDGQMYEINIETDAMVGDVDMAAGVKCTKSEEECREQEEVIERTYKLRVLKDKDLFLMLKILKKIGIKDFKNAFIQKQSDKQAVDGENAVRNIGILTAFDMADMLLDNLENVEEELYTLWSDISGIPVDEMKEMEFGTLPLMILDTFSNARNSSFFRVLSKFLS